LYTGLGLAVSAAIFLAIHSFSRPPPKTMTKEWQEATNEYLKVRDLTFAFRMAHNLFVPSDANNLS
jgi:cytochrome c oxidase subunit 4